MSTKRSTTTILGSALVALALLSVSCGGASEGAGTPGATTADGQVVNADGQAVAAPATTAPPPRHFTLAASGDILLHASLIAEAKATAGGKGYDFNPMFSDIKDLISAADVAICHQETTISKDNTKLTVPRTLSFNAPHEIADALKNAGFDGCDTASNHTWDRGLQGVNDTLDVLDAAGLKHAGSSRSQEDADNPPIYEINGVKIGHLAYSYTIFNEGGPSQNVPAEAPWLKSMLWPAIGKDKMIEDAKRIRARGAEFVVMSIHWGDQYVHQPNAQQRQLAKDLLSSPDVDLILGDHVHVVQPCEKIGDKYVMYGMGNFLSNQSPTQDRTLKSDNQDGSMETYTIDEVARGQFKVTKMTYSPTWVIIPGHKIVRATPDKYKDSYNRTVKNMNLLGPGTCDATPDF
jgi:poly-gamma-glutamate capsule biosynthesis protein CapA/YwtB (metallophosphatase superfamily)